MKQKIDDILTGLGKNALELADGVDAESTRPPSPEEKRKEDQRRMWHVLNEELGM